MYSFNFCGLNFCVHAINELLSRKFHDKKFCDHEIREKYANIFKLIMKICSCMVRNLAWKGTKQI